jgi:hypothetical protein
MAYEQKDMSGSLFRNDRREKDTHPHAKGSALIGGVEYWVSAWTKEARDGSKYQSLSFTPKEANGGGHTQLTRQQPTGFDADLEDDVPFASCDPSLECRVR